jgi:hypothetical protein
MLVCVCREIYEEDFKTPQELKDRIMEDDFCCGQCQLRYMLNKDVINTSTENL